MRLLQGLKNICRGHNPGKLILLAQQVEAVNVFSMVMIFPLIAIKSSGSIFYYDNLKAQVGSHTYTSTNAMVGGHSADNQAGNALLPEVHFQFEADEGVIDRFTKKNPIGVETPSDDWYLLKKTTFLLRSEKGDWQKQSRETYDRGNGATILLYNHEKATIILTRQFRYPTYVNGNQDGMMIEACAGLLDKDDPVSCIRKETEEETGYRVSEVEKVAELYMSPGSVTEKLYFFLARYDEDMKKGEGGGIAEEQENIQVLEISFAEAWQMGASGEINDAKTLLLMYFLKAKELP